jgi:hypothetical protein
MDRSTVVRQRRPDHHPVRLEATTVRAPIADDQPRRNGQWTPASLGGDPARETSLPVQCAQQLVEVHELRLELDDQQCASSGVPSEDVD